MRTVFGKAPLIELIAELRWLPAGVIAIPAQQQAGAAQMLLANDANVEEFFMRLGGELYQFGFQRSERIVPPGFPTVLGQPAVRFRSDDAVKKSVLYQTGSGVFSVHAIPPYRTWQDFVPQLENGLKALLKIRGNGPEPTPFTQATLRCLDFFNDDLLGGRTRERFISEVMGFCTTLPEAMTQVAVRKEVNNLFLKFVVPVEIGNLNVSVGDGTANNQAGVVLDTSVTTSGPIEAKLEDLMTMFQAAHAITGRTFRTFVRPIENLMEPRQLEN